MKIVKVLFIFVFVSMISVSCKETKKEEVQEDAAVEMTEEGSDASDMEVEAAEETTSSDSDAAGAAAGAGAAAAAASDSGESMEEAESVEATAKEVEPVVVPAGVIAEELSDTPLIYPGCSGSVEEIRACNKESFIAYIKSEFNHDIAKEDGGDGNGFRPKALMLSSLAGCSGLDVASLMKKMKLEVEEFTIETIANLTDEHPKFYDRVNIEYHFRGKNLNEKKLQRAVDLSVERYCGVMEMFRQFAELEIETFFHHS